MSLIAKMLLKDPMGNESSLLVKLENGFMKYRLHTSWNTSGMAESLSNLQCNLPVVIGEYDTKQMMVARIKRVINFDSVRSVSEVITPGAFVE